LGLSGHRSNALIPGVSVSRCVDTQWNLTLEEQKNCRRTLSSIDTLQLLDENTRITVQVIEMTWPIWDRQVVLFEKKETSQNEGWIISFSTTHVKAPLNEKKYVRAHVHVSAWGFIKESENVRVWRILHMNPNGDGNAGIIPEALIHVTSGSSVADSCNWFRSYVTS